MQDAWIPLLRCPATGAPYDLDVTRSANGDVVEGFLIAWGRREVRVVVAGVAILPRDLRAHLQTCGNVYEHIPLADSRVVRLLLGQVGRGGVDSVPFEEVVRRYGDLVPPGYHDEVPGMAPEDAALAALLAEEDVDGGRGLDVGCGVGRGVFVLCGFLEAALGVDCSLACVRRARNVAVTQADFFLPAPRESGVKEVAIDLDRLDRFGADFAVADPEALPLADASLDLVVLRRDVGRREGGDRAAALTEAVRVLAPSGLLVVEGEEVEEVRLPPGWTVTGCQGGFLTGRRV